MSDKNLSIKLKIDADGNVQQVLTNTNKQLATFDKKIKSTDESSAKLSKSISTIGHYAAGAFVATELLGFAKTAIMTADHFNVLQQRIKTATKETGDYSAVSQELYAISQRTGTALESNVILFQSLARIAPELKATNKEMLQLTQTLQQLGTIGGSTNEQMSNAMLQFGQAMSGGVMRAEEFNSIVENTPEIAARIAEGMELTVGQLRLAVLEGEVLSKDVFEALKGQTEQINAEFEKMPLTVGRSWASLENSLANTAGSLNETVNVTGGVAIVVKGWSLLLDEIFKKQTEIEEVDSDILEIKKEVNHLQSVYGDRTYFVLAKQKELVALEEKRLKILGVVNQLTYAKKPLLDLETEYGTQLVKDMDKQLDAAISLQAWNEKRWKETQSYRNSEKKAVDDAIKQSESLAKARKKEWDSILDSALNTAEATQQAMEEAWATRAENKYQNGLDAQWNTDNNNFDKLDEQDAILSQTLEMATAVDDYGDAWTRTGDKALDAMGSMLNVMDKVGANDKKYADQMIVMRKAGLTQTEEFIKLEKARAKNSIKGSMSMLDASVAMFEEGSAAQEAAHKASLVFHAVEMAMDMEKAISAATIAVAEQGKGDPYTAWARIGAMSVMMAGLLSQIGATFGGSSGSSSASYSQITQSDSGVLGGGESNALQNFNDRLMDVNAEQYNELRAINQNTKFLNQAMVSASSALYSTGTISGLSVDLSSFQKSDAVKLVELISDTVANIPVLGVFGDLFGGLVSNIAGAIFGGGTKRTSVGYGLNVGGALGNVGVGGYQTIKKKTDGGWFGKSKTSYYDINRAVDPQVGEAINSTFNYLGDTLVNFGDLLERDVSEFVGDLRVTTGKINLTGKSSAQVQEALTNAINVQSDKWAYELFSDVINQYQKIEESAFDTLSRLVIDKTVVEDVLKTTGQTVVGDALALSQSLISIAGSLNNLTDASNTYYDAFYSDAEKQVRLTGQLSDALGSVNLTLPSARDGYRSLVESLDLSTESGKQAYVTLLSLSDSADKYYTKLESLQSTYFDNQISLIKTTIDAYSGLKNALQSTYNSIMGIGSANSMDYISAQTVLNDAVINARSGSLPELASIQDALGVVSANSSSNYASYTDYQRDQIVTANMVDELIGYTDGALTVQDSMLNELEAQTALLSGIAVLSGVDGSHATGLSSVPFDGYTAELHKDEAVIDARTMQGLRKYGINGGGNSTALIKEVKALREQVKQMQDILHSGNLANATNTLKMSKLMDKWDIDGQPEVRQ